VKSLTIRDIPEGVYRELKRRAAAARRSLNAEVLVSLEHAVQERRLPADAALARADAIRERVTVPYLTDRDIRAARDAGRTELTQHDAAFDAARAALREADLRLSPEERLREAEELTEDAFRARPRPRIRQVLQFDSLEDYFAWKKRDVLW
jgi:plasmid stability protein